MQVDGENGSSWEKLKKDGHRWLEMGVERVRDLICNF